MNENINISRPCTAGSASTTSSDNTPSFTDIHVDVEQPIITSPTINADFVATPLSSYFSLPLFPPTILYPPSGINRRRFRRVAGLVIITLILITTLLVALLLSTKKKKGKTNYNSLDCVIKISVSKDWINNKSNFTNVSDAVEASPNYSPFKVCITIGEGEYYEIVKIGHEKINLIFIGEGIGKTVISSNASNVYGSPVAATLSVFGEEFLAQDLTIRNEAVQYGVAVENAGAKSIFFRCKFEGANATLYTNGEKQFYRDCRFYGGTNLVFGYSRAFFQKCKFVGEKSHPRDKVVFSSQTSRLSNFEIGFVFHLCAFDVVGSFANSSETAFLGSSAGYYAFVVVMESYLDRSVGGYFLGAPPNTMYYVVFRNVGVGATKANIPQFVYVLESVEAASKYSLREFLDGDFSLHN
ncbi:hypothetical protein MIMGU_mgv1a021640mg [Erythranthe guttata]|uniref:Pectinesterase catalytic domain-containing protein n=1 Tax=Erythranthe guttata TaxID=4155 RepID=A0A022QR59_ERYGU|nr:hypothetical protein MIMGU_mgv1a021640mg [Erythranthe guttata]